MDGSRFDRWTRRRFGHVAGITLAALLGCPAPQAATAKRKRRRKQRCTRPGDRCTRGGKSKCCRGRLCAPTDVDRQRKPVCCQDEGEPCRTADDCCYGFVCPTGVCELPSSDRAGKANFASVDPADMLARVRDLPISAWNYATDDPAVRHIGPMAQDFAAAFGVGADDRHIHPIDGQGVALAAIQGLGREIEALRAENAGLAARLGALETPAVQREIAGWGRGTA